MEIAENNLLNFNQIKDDESLRFCAEIMVKSDPWINLNMDFSYLLNSLKSPLLSTFVAMHDNKIIAFASIQMEGALSPYLSKIAVAENWRNKKIGTKLLKYVEEIVFNNNKNLFLCVSSFNVRAFQLYKKLGYEKIGEIQNYLVQGYSEILMRKTLGPITNNN